MNKIELAKAMAERTVLYVATGRDWSTPKWHFSIGHFVTIVGQDGSRWRYRYVENGKVAVSPAPGTRFHTEEEGKEAMAYFEKFEAEKQAKEDRCTAITNELQERFGARAHRNGDGIWLSFTEMDKILAGEVEL